MEIEELYTTEAHERGAEVKIKDPATGKLTDIVITVRGVDSKVFRRAKVEAHRDMIQKMQGGEEYDADYVSSVIISKSTIGWSGLTNKGEPLEFTEQRALELFTNAPAIREQVDAFIVDRGNFTKG